MQRENPKVQKSNDPDPEDDENNKSIYQTFMDVSSIFSKPILAFGKQKSGVKHKSRFFNEELEGELESDDDMLLNELNPAAFNNSSQEQCGHSIFSSGNLFPQQQRQLGGISRDEQSMYRMNKSAE